jgi:phosphinothricin acetyltransferase
VSLIIRSARPDRDAAACSAIYRPHVEAGPASFEERAPNPEEMAVRIRELCSTHPWLVAERSGSTVGFAYACPHRTRAAYRWAADVSVYISGDQRRHGVGRALYEALLERLRAQNFEIACAGITLPNEASVALHESLGFEAVGVYRRIGWKLGSWHDVGWWQLRLNEQGGPPEEPIPPAG